MVFGKRSTRVLDRFSKFIITAHLPLRRSRVKPRRIYRELSQYARGF
jgi:hypothetical protein